MTQSYATLTLSRLKIARLSKKPPTISFTVVLSKATTLTIVLDNGKRKLVAHWVKHLRAGTTKVTLVLPLKARHPGLDRLHLTGPSGRPAKTLAIRLRA